MTTLLWYPEYTLWTHADVIPNYCDLNDDPTGNCTIKELQDRGVWPKTAMGQFVLMHTIMNELETYSIIPDNDKIHASIILGEWIFVNYINANRVMLKSISLEIKVMECDSKYYIRDEYFLKDTRDPYSISKEFYARAYGRGNFRNTGIQELYVMVEDPGGAGNEDEPRCRIVILINVSKENTKK